MCLLGLLPALTVPMTLPCLAGNNAELPPNIIVVLTDDMGYGAISKDLKIRKHPMLRLREYRSLKV